MKKQVRGKKHRENGQSSINEDKLSIMAESVQVSVDLCLPLPELRGTAGTRRHLK